MIHPREYTIAGPENALAIVLIHGARMTRALWQPQIDALSSSLRVIAPDLPGHGALAGRPFSLDAAVAQIAAVVDAVAGGRAIVCGLSLGGYVALAFGARHPHSTIALVLSGCTFSFRGLPGRLVGAPYIAVARFVTRTFSPVLARIEERALRQRYPAALADPIIARGLFYRSYADISAELLNFDPMPALRTCDFPVLLLNGARDRFFRRHEQSYLRALRHGRLRLIDGAAHLANLDQPEAYTTALRDFVSEMVTVQ
ncbi:MAG: alpha/beta hydrolase [Roseiflexus sp.]|nr:alpha/beta hydrolase [Roseiflexus sp.]MCS7290439.1 alpha/beta hydrolase [Roseiflexus sp.]MDW8231503.1 alpha/beta hydrolase [Roseiflexaceae bacterium]